MRRYTVNEIFYSPQGEGMRAGEMSVFIRFTGCNLRCAMEVGAKSIGGFDCDTEFESGKAMTREEVVAEAIAATGLTAEQVANDHVWVVLSGGEPALQADADIVEALHAAGMRVAIETNGSIDVSNRGIDWITVSPKVAEHAVRQMTASEVKYVRGAGQSLPKPTCTADFKLLSPAFNGLSIDRKALETCLDLIRKDPTWRLSVQMHKAWRVR